MNRADAGSGHREDQDPRRIRTRLGAVIAFALITGLNLTGLTLTFRAGDPLGQNDAATLAFYAFPCVGVLIALRRPHNKIAWLCLLIGSLFALEAALWGIALYGMAHPGTVAHPELLAVIADPLPLPGVFLIATLLVLLFPDGSLPSPRWRWLAWLSAISITGGYVVELFAPDTSMGWGRPTVENPLAAETIHAAGVVTFIVVFPCIAASLVAMVRRYRRATGIERLQFKWLAASGLGSIVIWLIAVFVLNDMLGEGAALTATMAFGLVPVAIGVAVLRYRLYDIDRLISRTVTYAVVVAVLVGVYAGGVLLIGFLLPRTSDVAVAASTLAVAVLFTPLRRRVRALVDHRFNRARYDADREVARFAERLRDAVDLDELQADLLGIVGASVEPTTAGLWIRQDHR